MINDKPVQAVLPSQVYPTPGLRGMTSTASRVQLIVEYSGVVSLEFTVEEESKFVVKLTGRMKN